MFVWALLVSASGNVSSSLAGLQEPRESKRGGGTQPRLGYRTELEAFTSSDHKAVGANCI